MAQRAVDLGWAAGFLEGEGHFGFTGSPHIQAPQVQREPLERLARLFGGTIHERKIGRTMFGRTPCPAWHLTGPRAAGVMMTLYGLMSPRRQAKIREVLAKWRALPGALHLRRHCKQGHEFTAANTYRAKGQRRCLECKRASARRSSARHRVKRLAHALLVAV